MAEKQSLYELFGLSDKASPDDVQRAFAERRAALDLLPEGEDKHNRIAFLIDGRDVLLDRRQRAGYDRRQRDRRGADRRQASPGAARGALKLGALAACIGVAWYVGRQSAPPSPPANPTPVAVTPAAKPAASEDKPTEAESVAAEASALLPPPRPGVPEVPDPTSQVARSPASQPSVPRLPDSPQAATARAITESTYAVVGGAGHGTGVAIDTDKLLTNCHVIAPNVHKGPLLAIHAVTGKPATITHAAFLVREDACIAYAPGLNARPMPMGEAARLVPGATIYSLGFAQGRLTFSTGSFLGVTNRSGQNYLVSTNYCDFGVSGGPLVDEGGRLVGLTSGGTRDKKLCASLTAETARRVLDQTLIVIDAFPTDYLTNLRRRW